MGKKEKNIYSIAGNSIIISTLLTFIGRMRGCVGLKCSLLRYKFSSYFFTGVPYPAKFELPTTWSDTSYTLSWGVNCSINAPIINYQLSFKELPHGPWRSINIPGNDFTRRKKNLVIF